MIERRFSFVIEVASTAALLITTGLVTWSLLGAGHEVRLIADTGGAPSLGRSDGVIAIVEFSDFACSSCGEFAARLLPALRSKYISTGKVLFVFRHLPERPDSEKAAEAAQCALLQDRFWEMHEALFADQLHLQETSLVARAKKLGLNVDAFRECLFSGSKSDRVRQDVSRALDDGVTKAPAFLIGSLDANGNVDVLDRISGVPEELDLWRKLDGAIRATINSPRFRRR